MAASFSFAAHVAVVAVVAVAVAAGGAAQAQTIANAGFETPNVGSGTFSSFQYNPTGAGWTFSEFSGVSGNGSGFTQFNPNAPQGVQVGLIQFSSFIEQTINFPSGGTFQVSFFAAQRLVNSNAQTFRVTLDGGATLSQDFLPTTTTYLTYTSVPFNVGAGNHTLRFTGLNPFGGDNTAFVDAVVISAASVAVNGPEPASLALVGVVALAVVARRRKTG